jgi:hypothetical protein
MASRKEQQEIEILRILEEQLATQREIDALHAREQAYIQRNDSYGRRRARQLQTEIQSRETILNTQNKELESAEALFNASDAIDKKTNSFVSSFNRLSGNLKKTLASSNAYATSYLSINQQIVQEEQVQAYLSDDLREASENRATFLRDISTEMMTQAKSTLATKNATSGTSEYEQKRQEILENSLGLSEDQKNYALGALEATQNMAMQEQKLAAIRQGQQDIIGALPASLQSGIGFIKNMITGIRAFGVQAAIATAGITALAALIVAGLQSFTALEGAGEDFRKTTGLTNDQMGNLDAKVTNVTRNFGNLGIEAGAVYDTVAALKAETADFASYSESAIGALTVMTANFGVSAENAAKVQNIMESVGGLSEDTAANVQMQVADMAKMAGVAPSKVLADIADSAETASTLFKGDITLLAKQAVEARRLGTNLKDVSKTAEGLLDFESGIEKELKAATFVGGQFNLSTARGLAMQGKAVEAQKETLKQIQRSGDFRKQDYFTQKALADAAGMSVEDINKQLNVQEKLSKLSAEERANAEKAIEQGLDLSDISQKDLNNEVAKHAAQQEQASTLTELENLLKGMVAELGGALIPLFKGLMPVIKLTFFPLKIAAKAIGYIIDGITWLISKIPGLQALIDMAGKFADMDWFGPKDPIEEATSTFATPEEAQSAVLGMDVNDVTKTGDLKIKAGGTPMVSSNEGGLFKLSPNDDVAAAPNLLNNIKSQSDTNGSQLLANAVSSQLSASTQSNNTQSQPVQANTNLNALSAPLNAMINEIKALRADLASGKIAVNMDGSKVTSGIAKQVGKSTRNNFSLV